MKKKLESANSSVIVSIATNLKVEVWNFLKYIITNKTSNPAIVDRPLINSVHVVELFGNTISTKIELFANFTEAPLYIDKALTSSCSR